MQWTVPGTVLVQPCEDAENLEAQFSAIFLGGGMMLSQVSAITGLEPYAVQNWVKRGFLSSPEKKRYSLRQLCRILNINMLRGVLPMEDICGLLGYINGQLDDESDDIIDDSRLYFMFVQLASRHRRMNNPQGRDTILEEVLSRYDAPTPEARQRVKKVLNVMLTAWAAAQLRSTAEAMLQEINKERVL